MCMPKVALDIENPNTHISDLHIFSFETILKDHELIVSTYNRAADLNEKHLREINVSKSVISSLEQKISKVEEERDSLQLGARLIAQDKYEHFSDAKRPSTKSNMQITNGSSYDCASPYPLLNDWQNTHTHTSRSLQCENHNQPEVHLPSGHSQQSLQSQEGEILDRSNVSSEEPQFSQQSISHHNADCQRVGQSKHQSVVLTGDSIIKGIVS